LCCLGSEELIGGSCHINRIDTEGLAGPDCVTKKGQAIKADAHFVCVGKLVGSSWLKGSDLESAVDSNGRVMVDRNMRVQGHSNIFAVGDVSNTKVWRCPALGLRKSFSRLQQFETSYGTVF
jgi:NADH dehydrogenase FAD-containing subunit